MLFLVITYNLIDTTLEPKACNVLIATYEEETLSQNNIVESQEIKVDFRKMFFPQNSLENQYG